MSSLFKNYKMDESKEQNGVLVQFPPNDDKTLPTFKIARKGGSNVRFAKAMEQETRLYTRQIELGTLDPTVAEGIQRRVFIQACLMGWENVLDENNEQIPYNAEAADTLFTKLPELLAELQAVAQKQSLFRAEVALLAAKN